LWCINEIRAAESENMGSRLDQKITNTARWCINEIRAAWSKKYWQQIGPENYK